MAPEAPPPLPARLAADLHRDLGAAAPGELCAHRIEHGAGAGRRLAFLDAGPRSARPVLLLHGDWTGSFLWRRVAAALPASRTVAPDLPGHGLSEPWPGDDLSLAGVADALAELVLALGLHDLVLVGHDWGGPLAAALGERLPGRVEGVVLAGTAVLAPALLAAGSPFRPGRFQFSARQVVTDAILRAAGRPDLPLARLAAGRRLPEPALGPALRHAWSLGGPGTEGGSGSGNGPRRLLRRLRDRTRRSPLAALLPATPAAIADLHRSEAWLRRFEGPVALVQGRHDPLFLAWLARHQRAFPEAPATLAEAGWLLPEEAPGEVAAVVREVVEARRREPLPEAYLPGIGGGELTREGERVAALVARAAGLSPDDRVLDVGCGLGRLARPLARRLGRDGRYLGLDVVDRVIGWNRRNLARFDPRLRFRWVDVRNGSYNPRGRIDPLSSRFPAADGSQDLVVATSLFTHLLPEAVRHYLAECARVLAPGGRLAATFFLLAAETLPAVEAGTTDPVLPHRFPEGRLADPDRPEDAVAYRLEWLLERLAEVGLEPAQEIVWGEWSGRTGGGGYQDLVVARRLA